MALSNARLKAALDEGLTTTTHIAFSVNGTGETSAIPRTAATFAAASTADPSVAQLSAAFTSATCTATCTLTHRAGYTAATGGTITTTWVALTASVPLIPGGKLTMAAADCTEKLYADDAYTP